MGRWDLESGAYEQGGWLVGRIFPRRSDLSPDGRLLSYFAHKPSARWEYGEAYVALSRLPWLSVLHAFATCGTWTRGYCFSEDGGAEAPGGALLPLPYGLRSIPAIQFANERRRGWEEAPDSPRRDPCDAWDQHRNARMRKRQPGGEHLLCVESIGWAGGEFGQGQAVDGLRVRYSLESAGEIELFDDLQWADWDVNGDLLVATRSGQLQVRRLARDAPRTLLIVDLSRIGPTPVAAPAWAMDW